MSLLLFFPFLSKEGRTVEQRTPLHVYSHVSPPDNMLDDLQDGAEYAVNGVRRLYSQTRKPVPVMTWSAGGLIAQWTLTFFPQTREKVDRVVAFAPDYRGTIEAYLLTALQYISPDIWQQQTFSHFVTTLANAGGFQTIKPTTTMYSINDEIVEPETPDAIASGYLPGASNNRIQDVCGPLFLVEHSQELFNQATYTIATAALASKTGQAPAGSLTVANCSELPPAGLTPADVAFDITIIPQAGANILLGPKVTCEPPIRSYAAKYDTLPNTCFNNLTQSQQYANAKGFTAPFSSQQQVADYIAGNSTLTAAIKKSIGYSS